MDEVNKLIEAFRKLVDVKSIVTLGMTAVILFLAVVDKVDVTQVLNIYLIIIGFYFGTQALKKEDKIEKREDKTEDAAENL